MISSSDSIPDIFVLFSNKHSKIHYIDIFNSFLIYLKFLKSVAINIFWRHIRRTI